MSPALEAARTREPAPEIPAELDAALDPRALAGALDLPLEVPAELWTRALLGPAREFLARPGKRFRAQLLAAAYRLAGGVGAPPPVLIAIVELLHAGSLIVDDIEDDGLERRGAPALHRVVGTPLALNTGNWMYCWPSLLLARAGLPELVELAMHRDLQLCLVRSHHGQALDLALRVPELRRAEVPAVVAAIARLKTASLLELAGRLGARAAGAGDDVIAALGELGVGLGVGLQMLDDLGSVAAEARAGKANEDLGHARCTWPWAWLGETADDATWATLTARLRDVARRGDPAAIGGLAAELRRRIEPLGRARVHAHLGGALASLRDRFGAVDAVTAVEAELHRLEASYG